MASVESQVSSDGGGAAIGLINKALDTVQRLLQNTKEITEKETSSFNTSKKEFDFKLKDSLTNDVMPTVKGLMRSIDIGGGVKRITNLSDRAVRDQAELNLMLEDGGSGAAENSQSSYANVFDTVTALGQGEGTAFQNNDEVINFTGLMNKSLVVGGALAQEQPEVMKKTIKIMNSGGLKGDEKDFLSTSAPVLYGGIGDYMMKVEEAKGSMQEWAAEGLITADIIKNALPYALEDVGSHFADLPITWGQVWQGMQNKAVGILEPLLIKINELANSSEVQRVVDGITKGFQYLIVAAFNSFMLIATALTVVVSGVLVFLDVLTGVAYWVATLAKNILLWFANVGLAAGAIIQNIGAAFNNVWTNVQIKFWGFVEAVLQGVLWIANKINELLGVFGVEINVAGIENQVQNLVGKQKAVEGQKLDYKDVGAAFVEGDWGGAAYRESEKVGKGMMDSFTGAFDSATQPQKLDQNFVPAFASETADNTGKIASNTAEMADSGKHTSENLGLLRKLSEREVINRFTTAEIRVDMTGMNNTIKNETDVDGFMSIFTGKLEKALLMSAEGVHA